MAASADFAESAGPHCAASKATCDQGGRHPADSDLASASISVRRQQSHLRPGRTSPGRLRPRLRLHLRQLYPPLARDNAPARLAQAATYPHRRLHRQAGLHLGNRHGLRPRSGPRSVVGQRAELDSIRTEPGQQGF